MPLPRFEPSRPRSRTCIRSKSRPLGYSPFNDPGFLLNRRNLKEKKYSAFWRFSVCLDRWYKSTPYSLNILDRLISYINVQNIRLFTILFLAEIFRGNILNRIASTSPKFQCFPMLAFHLPFASFFECPGLQFDVSARSAVPFSFARTDFFMIFLNFRMAG